MTDIILTPTLVEGEPRIRDVDLAVRLGFERPQKIRELIQRHRGTLNKISVLPTVGQTPDPEKGGRPSAAFYLDRKQAIFITMKSETATATEVTREIIERFDAYERSLKPVVQPETPEMLALRAMQALTQIVDQQKAAIAQLAPKAEALERFSRTSGPVCISDACKAVKVNPKWGFAFLHEQEWIFRRGDKGRWTGYQDKIDAGLLVHVMVTGRDGEKAYPQVLMTPAGVAKFAELLAKRKPEKSKAA